jgi:beta-galactosidase/beta-glucuronidase
VPRKHFTRIGVREVVQAADGASAEGYPRPQLRRATWTSLDGPWAFAIDYEGAKRVPTEVAFDRMIQVPFAPETEQSSIGDTGLFRACWYRRTFEPPTLAENQRLLLHFGAVDYDATVWLNGSLIGRHEGGYTPFSIDITKLAQCAECDLVVRAFDDPADLSKPRGKQDWQNEPHSIWYARTSGIWQSVWLEVVPHAYIESLTWTPNLDRWELGLDVCVCGAEAYDSRELMLGLKLYGRGVLLVDDRYSVAAAEVHRRVTLSDPGIDDFRNELLWSPETPTLLDAELTLLDTSTGQADVVQSYTALRSFAVDRDRLVLNGRPYMLRMVLDQGYWPRSGMTPPDPQAYRRDVELTKAMGFNGVRKHQKIEDPRYLYWADRIGLLVWVEMPSAYRFTGRSVERLTQQWVEVINRDKSHPCIVAWVPFNESWGVPNLPDSAWERHYVQALYHLTRTLDPTRPVVGNDGWESVATDIIGIHDYDEAPDRLARRYSERSELATILKRERPGGRVLALGPGIGIEHPVVLSEFGGIAFSRAKNAWGYSSVSDESELEERYTALLSVVRSLPMLSGFCYTQFADTYQEANGLLYADRSPKIPIERIALATRGKRREPTWNDSRADSSRTIPPKSE